MIQILGSINFRNIFQHSIKLIKFLIKLFIDSIQIIICIFINITLIDSWDKINNLQIIKKYCKWSWFLNKFIYYLMDSWCVEKIHYLNWFYVFVDGWDYVWICYLNFTLEVCLALKCNDKFGPKHLSYICLKIRPKIIDHKLNLTSQRCHFPLKNPQLFHLPLIWPFLSIDKFGNFKPDCL